ncbi:superoxide dismutase family protein [Streptosporangium soli]|nr:superoxide dismutase family protein [Streptosporangium sp. KLBMP 9127]
MAPQDGGPGAVPASASPTGATPEGSPTGSPTGKEVHLVGEGTFEPYKQGATAVVYDEKLVPSGAMGEATIESTGTETESELFLEGMLPNRKYGAHLHVNACGEKPDDSGPHFRWEASPSASPNQPATRENEIWLDISTNGEGDGDAHATQPWALTKDRLPGSVVIHAKETTTTGPQAGQAGDRVACLTLNPSDD